MRIGKTGPGEECARSDIDFAAVDFDEDEEAQESSKLLRSRLISLAGAHNNHEVLYIDETGRCFGGDDAGFTFQGDTFGEAVQRLLLGYRARPMLRPDEDVTMAYGDVYRRGHPDIFEYRS